MKIIWFICGLASLGFGVLGIFLPLLPTVPLILLAAFCFARSSQRMHDWLLNHPRLGPPIKDWQQNGAIQWKAKVLATFSIAIVFTISLVLGLPVWVLAIQAAVLSLVMLFIWTRPNG